MDDYVRLPDVSRRLGVPYQTLYKAAVGGEIPIERCGTGRGFYAVKAADLQRVARHFGAGVRFDAGAAAA